MSNFVILPVLIPFLTGILLIFMRSSITMQRFTSFISAICLIAVNLYLLVTVQQQGIQTIELGGWQPPFGIILVGDGLSVLLITTTSLISLAALWYSFESIGIERERFYYYPFLQFLITGVTGAFLTGDIFNLFVFFEVMLISSYALIVHGGTVIQLRESVKYVLINVVSSALFVVAVAYLYAITGTLNMAQLAERVGAIESNNLLTVVAVFFLIVFGLKGGLFPLYFWLPGSYSAPPPAIAAIFGALLTKVGIYAVFRTYTLIFTHDVGFTHHLLAILAALTMLAGVIGAVAHNDIKKILVYNVIVAVGFVLFGVATLSPAGMSGAIYYLLHDMVVKGLLFLLIGATIVVAGTSNLKNMGGLIKHHPKLGWMFFVAILALVGVPPLSGFIGKVLLIQGGVETGYFWIVAAMIVSSLLVLYSMIRIFLSGFFGKIQLETANQFGTTKGLLLPCAFLLSLSILMGLGAEWLYPFVSFASETLSNPDIYIDAVLKE